MCYLQQGYECTRRFLTEFITSPSDVSRDKHHDKGPTTADSEQIVQNYVQCTQNQAVHEFSVTKLGKLCTSCNGLSNAVRMTPAAVDCALSDDDSVPWCTASWHAEVAGAGLDSSYSEASVLETEV